MGGSVRTLAWVGAIGAFLAIGYSVAITAYEDPAPSGEPTTTTVLYERTDHCEEPCHSAASSDTFSVTGGMEEIHFVVYAVLDPSSGPAYVSVTDPSGDVRYERLFMNDASERAAIAAAGAIQDAVSWSAELGEWTLTRSYVGVAGMLDFQAWADGSQL